jgi:hypothetical protein
VAKGSFGVEKVSAPSKNPTKCPIICFAPDKKIIIQDFQNQRYSTLVFFCPKKRERKRARKRESESESGKGKGKRERERENKSAGNYIYKPPGKK